MEIRINTLTHELFLDLYRSVGWEPPCIEQVKAAGKCLLTALERYVKECKPLEWAVSLELISSKEAVDFYERFGFEKHPCDWDTRACSK